jgi:hypothetical protein
MSQVWVAIRGNTFPVKDQLHKLGGVYNRDSQTWSIPAELADEAVRLVRSAGPQQMPLRATRRRK